ncbi:MAG TPA: hypothetical protein VGS19_29140 [Streptosporangiaceae bacterium]|nr:hypothetical protein [Streptosporangiaceae bacterium]
MSEPCCDLHGRNCEPPGDLCCGECTEANHPNHPRGERCSSPDVSNMQVVGKRGDTVVVTFPKQVMSRQAALVHAAWLVSVADPLGDEFPAILAAVQGA